MEDRERRKCVIMKNLGCDEKTALEILEFDKQVDQGLIKDDLTPEQKKAVKKYTQVARGVNAYGKEQKREVKADEPKRYIIELINMALANDNQISEIEITNIQKNITFKIGNDTYEIDLKRKRKK